MADTQALTGQVTVTGNVAFYRKPEPLSSGAHGGLGVRRDPKPFGFASQSHIVPITIGEFAAVGLDYPIIFTPDDKLPLAVMGLANAKNLFIRDDGSFEPYRYVPAFIRRYPFVFAEDKQNQRFIACIDVEAPMVSRDGEVRLFEGSEATQYTKDAVSFLTQFEQQRRETMSFTQLLADNDLFEKASVTVNRTNPDGSPAEPLNLGEYIAVSANKVRALPAEKLAELNQNGALGAIFVHLQSLRNWQMIIQRASDRAGSQPSADAQIN